METNEAQPRQEQLEENLPPPQTLVQPDIIHNPSDAKDTTDKTKVATTPPQEPVRIIIEQDKRKDRHAAIANFLSFLALCLAGGAFYYTYKLYDKTIEANQISKNALELAYNQFEQGKKDNESARIENEKISIENNAKYRKQFSLDSQSVVAQINAFSSAQKKSEIENRPFVQVYNIRIDTSDRKGEIKFHLINYGKYPANILYVKYRIGVALAIKPNDTIYFRYEKNERKIYIAPGVNSLPEIQFMKATSNDVIKAFKNGQSITYLDVEIKYSSYVTNKTFLHTSLSEIRYGNLFRSIRNDDTEIKN